MCAGFGCIAKLGRRLKLAFRGAHFLLRSACRCGVIAATNPSAQLTPNLCHHADDACYPDDDLLAACRTRGLPIGNLTSQFWSNVFMHDLDAFVVRGLGITAYVRYVDDIVLFDNSRSRLWEAKRAIVERLARLRLRLHETSAQVQPCAAGILWLGMVVYPDHLRVKARKVRHATRSLGHRYEQMLAGQISFGEFDASMQGWINHVAQAVTWGLRRHVLAPFQLPPGGQPGLRWASAGLRAPKISGAASRRPSE